MWCHSDTSALNPPLSTASLLKVSSEGGPQIDSTQSLPVCAHTCKTLNAQGWLQPAYARQIPDTWHCWHEDIIDFLLVYMPPPLVSVRNCPTTAAPEPGQAATECTQPAHLPPRSHSLCPTCRAQLGLNRYIHPLLAALLSTAVVGAMLLAIESVSTFWQWHSGCRKRAHALLARLMTGTARSATDLASPARAGQRRLRHIRRLTYRWVTNHTVRQYRGWPSPKRTAAYMDWRLHTPRRRYERYCNRPVLACLPGPCRTTPRTPSQPTKSPPCAPATNPHEPTTCNTAPMACPTTQTSHCPDAAAGEHDAQQHDDCLGGGSDYANQTRAPRDTATGRQLRYPNGPTRSSPKAWLDLIHLATQQPHAITYDGNTQQFVVNNSLLGACAAAMQNTYMSWHALPTRTTEQMRHWQFQSIGATPGCSTGSMMLRCTRRT